MLNCFIEKHIKSKTLNDSMEPNAIVDSSLVQMFKEINVERDIGEKLGKSNLEKDV
jgi:hypothetical protein